MDISKKPQSKLHLTKRIGTRVCGNGYNWESCLITSGKCGNKVKIFFVKFLANVKRILTLHSAKTKCCGET